MDEPPSEGIYRVPSADTIKAILLKILRENKTIRSQTRLHSLIVRSMAASEPNSRYRLSQERVRRIAASMPEIKMLIHCRDSEETFNSKTCPVCASPLEMIRNQTLYGWVVNTGRACGTCGYWTGSKMRKPVRYVFIFEQERPHAGDPPKEV